MFGRHALPACGTRGKVYTTAAVPEVTCNLCRYYTMRLNGIKATEAPEDPYYIVEIAPYDGTDTSLEITSPSGRMFAAVVIPTTGEPYISDYGYRTRAEAEKAWPPLSFPSPPNER